MIMELLEMMKDSECCQGVNIHVGTGWTYIEDEHVAKMVDHYSKTGENLLDSYSATIAWNDENYVSYKLNQRDIDPQERSRIASRISKIRKIKVFEPAFVHKALFNCQELDKERVRRKKTKVEKRRDKASKFISKPYVRNKVFELHGEECLKCGSDVQICLDHIVPVSRGGKDKIDNLQPLCFTCNASKGTKIKDYRDNE